MSHNVTTEQKLITLKEIFIETYNHLKRICHRACFPVFFFLPLKQKQVWIVIPVHVLLLHKIAALHVIF